MHFLSTQCYQADTTSILNALLVNRNPVLLQLSILVFIMQGMRFLALTLDLMMITRPNKIWI